MQTNNINGLPIFQPYGSGPSKRIQHQHQAIIPSYKFNCCGNITEWGVDLNPDGTDAEFDFILQVWRPLNANGCYTLVDDYMSTAITTDVEPESRRFARVTLSAVQDQLQFQSGDVLGFYVESYGSGSNHDNGVALLVDANHSSELVWFASIDTTAQTSQSGSCPYPVGTAGVLDSLTRAAPVISISMTTYLCPQSLSTTALNPTSTTLILTPSPASSIALLNSKSDITELSRVPQQTVTVSGSVRDTSDIIVIAGVLVTIAVVVCIIFVTITTAVVIKKYCIMEKVIDASTASSTQSGITLQSDQKYSKCMKIRHQLECSLIRPNNNRFTSRSRRAS